jgi:hypothetical protein
MAWRGGVKRLAAKWHQTNRHASKGKSVINLAKKYRQKYHEKAANGKRNGGESNGENNGSIEIASAKSASIGGE